MAMEDAGGTGDLALMINTEMIILKGAVKASTYAGKTIGKGMIAPLRLIQYIMKLRKEQRISESDFKNFTQFMKDCEGDYIIANLPTRDPERLDELMDSMTEVGITYCMLPDLDIQDSCCQIAIRGKDVAKWQALYESYVTGELDLGGPLDFEELKALTSGNYKIKNLALGDSSEDNEQLEKFLDMLDERKVNYAVLPDLKYGDNHIQLAVANQSLPQFSSAIEAYLQEFPSARKDIEEDLTERQYYDSGRMSEDEYFNTATEDIKEKMRPEKWRDGKDRISDSFEQALVGKELSRYETLKTRPGLMERYVPAEKIVAKQGDEIAIQVEENVYVRIQEALSIDNKKGCVIFLDPAKEYTSYHLNDTNDTLTPAGTLSGKSLSRYTEKAGRDIVQRLDYIPYEEPNVQSASFTIEPNILSPSMEAPELHTSVFDSETPVTFPAKFLYSDQLDTQVIARIPGTPKYVQMDLISTLYDGKTILAAIDPQKKYTILENTENGLKPVRVQPGDDLLTYYDRVRPDAQKEFERIVNQSPSPQDSSRKKKKTPLPKKDKTMKL